MCSSLVPTPYTLVTYIYIKYVLSLPFPQGLVLADVEVNNMQSHSDFLQFRHIVVEVAVDLLNVKDMLQSNAVQECSTVRCDCVSE